MIQSGAGFSLRVLNFPGTKPRRLKPALLETPQDEARAT